MRLALRDHAADQGERCESFAALCRAFGVSGEPLRHGPEHDVQLLACKALQLRDRHEPEREVDFEDEGAVQIHYWRKHPNLHGWMERLYHDKGGAQEYFNCANLRLTAADLDALELAVKTAALPPTTGFFFGQTDGSEINDDLAFIAKAREALAANLTVFYSSWW